MLLLPDLLLKFSGHLLLAELALVFALAKPILYSAGGDPMSLTDQADVTNFFNFS